MQKMADNFKVGKYKIKKKTKRRQGEQLTHMSKLKIIKHGVKFAIGFVFVVFVVLGALMVGVGVQSSAVKPKVFKTRAEGYRDFKAMAVIEESTGRLLMGHNESDRLPMASTTKIATAIVTIEEMGDLTKSYTVPDEAIGIEGTSMYLRRGEKLTLEEYLYGLMLPSANDSAVALSIIVAGSEEKFSEKLNALASKLGLKNTNFVTASGLHDINHYTSAEDLAILTAYAMQNETFKRIVGTKFISVTGSKPDEPRHLKNKQKLMDDKVLKDSGIIVSGVKSGFTPEAGRCLVTSATNGNMDVIVVLLNAPKMFESTTELLLEVFDDYKMVEVVKPKQHISTIDVKNGKKNEINVYSSKGFAYPLTIEEQQKIKVSYEYDEEILAPIEKDQKVGCVEVLLYDNLLFRTPILSIEEVNAKHDTRIIKKIIKDFIS